MAGNIDGVMNNALDGIRKMVDVDTVIGEPIRVSDSVTLIPVSKVSFGFAAGGSSFGKTEKENFGGGAGGGVNVVPVAFIAVSGETVKVLPISNHPDAVDKIAAYVPDVVDKISSFFEKKDKTEDAAE